MYKVTFKFENSEDVTVFAAFGESLLEVARKTNVAIDAPCSGNASCGKCIPNRRDTSVMKNMHRDGVWHAAAK